MALVKNPLSIRNTEIDLDASNTSEFIIYSATASNDHVLTIV